MRHLSSGLMSEHDSRASTTEQTSGQSTVEGGAEGASGRGSGETFGSLFRRSGAAGPLAIVASIMPPLGGFVLLWKIELVGEFLRSHGTAGLALYAFAFAVLAGLALLPTYAQAVLGGWAFGFAAGFPAALAGFFGGALIGYGVAWGATGDRVKNIIDEHPKWKAVRQALIGSGFFKTLGIVALLRLPPNSPFALTNLAMAAAKVPRLPYLLGTLIGMAPRTGVAVYIASQIQDLATATETRPKWLIFAGIGLTIVVIVVIGHIAKKALERVTRSAELKPCPRCGYSTVGLPHTVCPECGVQLG